MSLVSLIFFNIY